MGLALPGGLMVGLEAWSFDWTMVLAAHFVSHQYIFIR
jgi:hypothetical protein